MLRLFSSVLLATSLVPTMGMAQGSMTPLEGQQIRVAHRCKNLPDNVFECRRRHSPRVESGYLQALDRDTIRLLVRSRSTELAIPTGSIDQVWVVDGMKGNFWSGAGFGLLGGALIGGLLGSTQEFCVLDCSQATPLGVILGAPVGFLLGGIIGAQVHSDRWREIRVGPRVSVAPRLDRLGLSLSVAF